jgi:hypothetical protein
MVNLKKLFGMGGAPKPATVPAVLKAEGAGSDSHEERAAAALKEVQDAAQRLPVMEAVKTMDDAEALLRHIYTTGTDMNGVSSKVVEAHTGETLSDLERAGRIESRKIVLGVEPPRVYAVARTWGGMQLIVFKSGEEIERWTYEEPKKITE